ncbi:pilus (MSHA type) biogenesis protein MshL [Halorhodospira halochloris]|nr:pilus (MSHA type) biogenesis protein MshL [Halorhodospira halochloris]MBK1651100.1 pilus (MSHA type) biogenesis protein MshL [Halorhodospira halochloris]
MRSIHAQQCTQIKRSDNLNGPSVALALPPAKPNIAVLTLVVTTLLGGTLLSGCAGMGKTPEQRAQQAEERLTPEASSGPAQLPDIPRELEEQLAGPPLLDPFELRTEEPRFDIKAQDVPAVPFFQGLVEDTPYNIIVHPDVEGTLSMTLRDVSVPEVMELAREVYGYEYRQTDVAYLVLPPRLESRLFQLDYLNVLRSGESGSRITAGELQDGDDGDSLAGSSVRTESESKMWQDVKEVIEGIIAHDRDNASAVVSPEASTVAVRATPATLRQVEQFIENLQGTITRQVVLEARILEVELSDQHRMGIEWETLGSPLSGSLSTGADVGIEPSGTFGLGIDREGSFSATISALQRQGDVQVLSAPRVSTLNHQKAVIKVGTDEFYQTGIDLNQRVIDNTIVTELDPTFEPFFSGIALDVTPAIDANGWITMHVQPSVTEVQEEPRQLESGGDTTEFNLARSDVRQSDSIVRAQDGEMIIIGGLIEERDKNITGQVPLLGNLPLLGRLFSYERVESQKYELVILLRPRIVNEDTWRSEIDAHSERIRGMYGTTPGRR